MNYPLRQLFALFLISILGIAIYANSLGNQFVWDDDAFIRENVYIKHWSCFSKIFTTDVGAGSGLTYHYYRPLQVFTYMVDYSIWKLVPIGYHLTNILLHILVALLIYWFILLISKNTGLSFLTSILFIAHPIHTEAVSYLSGRGDSLSALFMLLCFILYIKQLHLRSLVIYLSMMLSYAFALLSKENSIIMPSLLLLYHYSFKERIKTKGFLSILGLAALYILLRLTVLRYSLPEEASFINLCKRIPGFFVAITNYSRLLLAPFNLHIDYGKKLFSPIHPKAILGIIILLVLLFYAFRKRRVVPLTFFSISWIFIALLPSTNIYPALAFYMAEHYLYLPSLGFFIILARGLISLYRIKRLRQVGIFFIAILLIFYSGMTIYQNNYWKDPKTIYEKTLKYAPDSARALGDLGNVYNNMGRYKEAINLLKKSIQLDPANANAYNNLGNAYYAIGDSKEAIALYDKALQFEPDVKTYNNIANSYAAVGNIEKAMSLLKKAIELNADYPGSYYNLGVIYMGIGKKEEAMDSFNKALKLEPNFPEAYVNLAVIYNNTARPNEAISLLRKAIDVNPVYGKAYFNLSVIYFSQKEYNLAVEYCDKAIEHSYQQIPVQFLDSLKPYRNKQ